MRRKYRKPKIKRAKTRINFFTNARVFNENSVLLLASGFCGLTIDDPCSINC